MTVSPLQLTFAPQDWWTPQAVYIYPVDNNVYDAGEPLTITYDLFVAKKNQPLLAISAQSTDSRYNGIAVGGNEPRPQPSYVSSKGVIAIIQDDETGCRAEYTCANGGVCVPANYTGASGSAPFVCRCPPTFGMRDCSAVCPNARGCKFNRVELRLRCQPDDPMSICGDKFRPERLASTIYRMLAANEFTSADGRRVFQRLALGPMAEVLYIVNATSAPCVQSSASASTPCVSVLLDFARQNDQDTVDPIVEKLQAYVTVGSLQSQPVYAEMLTHSNQFPRDIGASVAVWVFIGICLASIGGVGWFFSMRYVRLKRFHVRPHIDEADSLIPNGTTATQAR
ncbi:hypothetical protein PINS_up001821 [Pythium insidiosum]|nr:hypothetical protein PINS_up001821 [Pythium insidiosum]